MSNHRFPNLGQIFAGDQRTKVMEGIASLDMMDHLCNCNQATKRDGMSIIVEAFGFSCAQKDFAAKQKNERVKVSKNQLFEVKLFWMGAN